MAAGTLSEPRLRLGGAEKAKDADDYFTWSDELLEQCLAYLNRPSLVIHLSHAALADLLKNLVMANGRSDHTTPPHAAMQLGSMLRREGAEGNQ